VFAYVFLTHAPDQFLQQAFAQRAARNRQALNAETFEHAA
jgi:hypothetical protein